MPRSREDQRRARAERYAHYRSLCAQFNVRIQEPWDKHYQQLNPHAWRPLTKPDLFAFWRERLTDEEIRDCGMAITPTAQQRRDWRQAA